MIEDIVKSDLKTILHSKRANLYYLLKNAKSAKRNGNEIFVIKYYEDIDDYAEVKYKLSVTKDLVGAIGCSTRSIKRSEL